MANRRPIIEPIDASLDEVVEALLQPATPNINEIKKLAVKSSPQPATLCAIMLKQPGRFPSRLYKNISSFAYDPLATSAVVYDKTRFVSHCYQGVGRGELKPIAALVKMWDSVGIVGL